MMLTDVDFGGKDVRTAYATLSLTGTLVSFEWLRAGLPIRYSGRP
jgi:gluconolactonase